MLQSRLAAVQRLFCCDANIDDSSQSKGDSEIMSRMMAQGAKRPMDDTT